MKSGAPAFGTPEYMKAQLIGGQLARRYKIPYRTSNTCAANTVDAQAAYESVFSLWGAIQGGANFMLHGAGWLEGGLRCSYEKTILDIDLSADGRRVPDPARPLRRSARRRRDPLGRSGRAFLRHAAHAGPLQDGLLRADHFGLAQFRDLGGSRFADGRWRAPTASGRSGSRPTRSRTWTRRSRKNSTPSSKSAGPKAAPRRIFERQ